MARPRSRRRLWPWLLGGGVAVLAAALAAAGAYFKLQSLYRAPGPQAQPARIEVAAGASLRAVLGRLEALGAVRSARAIEWYLRVRGWQVRVQAGLYELPAHATPEQIIEMFEQGRVVLEQLTVVEGTTFAEFLEALAQQPDVLHTLADKSPAQVMAALGHAELAPEGEFFPDTYRFAARTADVVILGLAFERMQHALSSAWTERSAGLPLASPYQALILASMIEKEAALKEERARIAGVFTERLRRGMRLQSDPTVIYGLGAQYTGSIHGRDLLRDTPYNTYTRAGLPPTPIALPGAGSIAAAVHPDESGALYFVATGLGDGAHHFSRTLEEHNSAVRAYLIRLRAQERAERAAAGTHR